MNRDVVGLDAVPEDINRWPVSIDGEELGHLRARYQDRVQEEDEWEAVRDVAARILSHCPNPNGQAGTSTGLALGKVQSGKTLSYTTVIALGMDNGYRMSIVLAGTKNPLLEQNYGRLGYDLETATRASVTPFKNPAPVDGGVIRSVLEAGGHALLIVLKNRRRIDDMVAAIAAEELSAYPTLIIDDEGDEASLNTQFRRGRQSAVYASILRLRARLSFHAYVAYTATPQANLLISGIDGLSPDFGVLVPPGRGYCGGSIFFGPQQNNFIRTVSLADAAPHQATRITPSLRSAIASFVVGAAVRHIRDNSAWHSFLIHTSQLRVDHEALQLAVRELVSHWRDTMRLGPTDPSLQDLITLFRQAYDDLRTTVGEDPSWEEIRQRIPTELGVIEVWMVNSLSLGRDPVATPFRLVNNILIGGNMLSRGVTIPGLAVTYITRRAQTETNADTMEQRARWFGYKQPYLDLCRIYVTDQLRNDYTELLRHEDDFWESLRRHERQGLSVRQWPRMFRLDASLGMNPTRANVANYKQFRGAGWDVQNQFPADPAVSARNMAAARTFYESQNTTPYRVGGVEHLIVRDCPTETVISQLLARIEATGTDWENAYYAEYLSRLAMANRLPAMDVVIVNKGDLRERGHSASRFTNLMQGRSPGRQPTDPLFYPGDREIHQDRVQLQLHFVSLRDTDPRHTTLALALYIPDSDQYDLRYVIRDES